MKSDTTQAMRDKYSALLADLTPGERLSICCGMFDAAKALAEAGLADEPNPAGDTLRARLFLRFYGRDFPTQECERIMSRLNRV